MLPFFGSLLGGLALGQTTTTVGLIDGDGDGYSDSAETAAGTNPGSAASTPTGPKAPYISEFVAQNTTGFEDAQGKRSDWLEITNPDGAALDLAGWYLTDDNDVRLKWAFPAGVSVPAGGTVVVFADGNDGTVLIAGQPHASFKLSAGGEFLGLSNPQGELVAAYAPTYPQQTANISYGTSADRSELTFFQVPTPGAANQASVSGFVADTKFTPNRGFPDQPFDLTIESATSNAEIRYTLDGSEPTPTTGLVYSGPIRIEKTTNVRAMAHVPGTDMVPTNIDTHSFIFVDQVAVQPKVPEGWPADWGRDAQIERVRGFSGPVPADYEMDPRVVNDTLGLRNGVTIRDALLDVPSIVLTMPRRDFAKSEAEKTASDEASIYGTPTQRIEFTGSIEYLRPDGVRGFQDDVIMETHGNSSRTPFRMQKHSIRITFSGRAGSTRLRYNLFPESPVKRFNKLVLRACFTDSWGLNTWAPERYRPNDSLLMRDVWSKEAFGRMGQQQTYGNFVHLYLNGVYFGLHNMTERFEQELYAEHLGGNEEDWIENSNFVEPDTNWNAILNLLRTAGDPNSVYPQVLERLDIENYIDYLLLHFYGDAEDWPQFNGYAAVNTASGDGKYRFFVWDQEIILDKFNWDRYKTDRAGRDYQGALQFFQFLIQVDDFKTLLADRVHMHLYDGGALSPEKNGPHFREICDRIDKAIVAESARWGDTQALTPYGDVPSGSDDPFADNFPPLLNDPIYFTREQHWVTERDHVINVHMPTLVDPNSSFSIVNEMRSRDLYPDSDPPVILGTENTLQSDSTLVLSAPDGEIFYTTDGSDPRQSGGAPGATATRIAAASASEEILPFESSGWRYLTGTAQSDSSVVRGTASYNASDWKHPDFDDSTWDTGQGLLASANRAISGVTTNTIFGRQTTVYLRREVPAADLQNSFALLLRFIRDDGCLIYLNGREVVRSNLASGVLSFTSTAIDRASPESEIHEVVTPLGAGDISPGKNVIAVTLFNQAGDTRDLGFDLSLTARKADVMAGTIPVVPNAPLLARTRLNGEWSALRRFQMVTGTPASRENLVISEINYNPAGSGNDLEFIELTNISSGTINLSGVTFIKGITYTFPAGTTLDAGAQMVVARNPQAMRDAYRQDFPFAPRAFTGSLSNDGEPIVIEGANRAEIARFLFLDEPLLGWPALADNGGRTLELRNPSGGLNLNESSAWAASATNGGTPGAARPSSSNGRPTNPTADEDGDGIRALVEYLQGTSDTVPNASGMRLVQIDEDEFELSYPVVPGQLGLTVTVETSANLVDWSTGNLVSDVRTTSALPSGKALVTHRLTVPLQGVNYFRLDVR